MASGVALGLLVHVYFYYWTAAGLAHLLLTLDRQRWGTYLRVAVIGVLVGLPALVAGALLTTDTSADWMLRSDKFVPIGHFEELLVTRAAFLLFSIAFLWLWRARRELLPLWCHAAAGLVLLNHQLVSGLQIENFHWTYVYGPGLAVLTASLAADGVRRLMPYRAWAAAVVTTALVVGGGGHVASAVWLRAAEASRTASSISILEHYGHYREQRALRASAPVERGGVAGDSWFVDFAAIFDDQRPLARYSAKLTPSIDNVALDERVALNAVLLGQTQAEFELAQRAEAQVDRWGPTARDPVLAAARLRRRVLAFTEAERGPTAAAVAAGIHEVALPAGARPPSYLRSSDWSRL
ncbi:MAG: hypothetical protein P8J30_05395 [Ilumatobacter sp.]|nr:hypothetical protein [Ilumatobacter sp.]